MGPGGISIWQLLIILVIVVLLFGTKKLRGMGGDLGTAIKSFRKSVKEESSDDANAESVQDDAAEATEAGETADTADTDSSETEKEKV